MNTNGGHIVLYCYLLFAMIYQFFFFIGYQGISFVIGHGHWWSWWGLPGVFQCVGSGWGVS